MCQLWDDLESDNAGRPSNRSAPGRGCANSWNMKERSTDAWSLGHWKMLATT